MKRKADVLFFLCWATLLSLGCADKKDNDPADTDSNNDAFGRAPIPDGKGRIFGVITDGDGVPIEGVSVVAGAATGTTDFGGSFLMDITPGQTVVRFSKQGYAPSAMAVPVTAGIALPIQEGLLARSAPVMLNIDEGGTVGEAARATVTAGALASADGTPATGVISAYITLLDVMGDLTAAPGDFSAVKTTGAETRLETLGMAEYYFEDAVGNPLNVTAGKTVTVEMNVPLELNPVVGTQIPAWFFDETAGKWKEEGVGQVAAAADGTLVWRVDVSHFSWWNADVPIDERDCVNGTITDCNGNPVRGASVEASGVSYRGQSYDYPLDDGTFCLDIKKGGQVDLLVVGDVNGKSVGRRAMVTGAGAGASCEQGGGGCTTQNIELPCDPAESDLECGDSPLLPCKSCLSGRVVTPAGVAVGNAVITMEDASSGYRGTALTNADGTFCISAPLNSTVELKVNATGYPPYTTTVTVSQEGQCPNCQAIGDITLEEAGTGGTVYENCNQGDVQINAVDLDGADASLGSLPYKGMMLIDNPDENILTGILWLSDADDPDKPDGSSVIYLSFEVPRDAAAGGSATIAGIGQFNSGGVVGVNSEYYTIDTDSDIVTWNEAVTGVGQTLTGTLSFALATSCGMALRNIRYEGTFSMSVLDIVGYVNMIDCTQFLAIFSSLGTESYGVVTLSLDGTAVNLGTSYTARYSPTDGKLSLMGSEEDGSIFVLSQDSIVFGSQSISQIFYSDATTGCYYEAFDVPELIINTNAAADLSIAPLTGSFTAPAPVTGDCTPATRTLSGTFTAAICSYSI